MSSIKLERLASMVESLVLSGLAGTSSTININRDEVIDLLVGTYMQLVTNYARQNLLPVKDLYLTLNCIPVDCKAMTDCCDDSDTGAPTYLHFVIPQVCFVASDNAIGYIGNTEKSLKFKWYTSPQMFEFDKYRLHKSRRPRPVVYINPAPNKDNLLDCYIKGLDFLDSVSVTAIFKDLRQVAELDCCGKEDIDNTSALDNEVVDTVVKKFFTYYRQAMQPVLPQTNNPGNGYLGAVQNVQQS